MELINNVWKFPLNVEFEMVHQCSTKFEGIPHNRTITFDLSKTEKIHSSFIGFLIHARQVTKKQGGKLILSISPSLERIFIMQNIIEFLPCVCVRKSA